MDGPETIIALSAIVSNTGPTNFAKGPFQNQDQ